jgi:hypothetical protein
VSRSDRGRRLEVAVGEELFVVIRYVAADGV